MDEEGFGELGRGATGLRGQAAVKSSGVAEGRVNVGAVPEGLRRALRSLGGAGAGVEGG